VLIRDKEKANEIIKKELDKLVEEDKIRYSYVEKVKIRNRFTKEEQTLRDTYFMALDNNASKPLCIMAIADRNNVYVLHDDITHWNMSEGVETYTLNDHTYYCRTFCNTVLNCHIWKDPNAASKFLKGNLMEGNPNDRYRTPESTEVDILVRPVYERYSANIFKKDATFEQVVLRRFDTTEKTRDEKIILRDIKKQLGDGKVYAYIGNAQNFRPEFCWSVVDKKDIEEGKYLVSSYYKQYELKDVDEIGEIPREELDIACVGCGSAGANIMEQINRTEYFNKYMLIDFDKLEKKNLRNQPYNIYGMGNYKTRELANILKETRSNAPSIIAVDKKYEEANFVDYSFKYLISGFDTIKCRLGLLEKVKSGEIQTKYIIDTRYNELESSLYFIDTSDKEQMEYYENLLKEDGAQLEKEEVPETTNWTEQEVKDYCYHGKNILHSDCKRYADILGIQNKFEDITDGETLNICVRQCGEKLECESTECLKLLAKTFEQYNVPKVKKEEENTCLAVNIIHIYKLTSAWVTSVIRGIETDEKKVLTHAEITADPLPNAIIIKR